MEGLKPTKKMSLKTFIEHVQSNKTENTKLVFGSNNSIFWKEGRKTIAYYEMNISLYVQENNL